MRRLAFRIAMILAMVSLTVLPVTAQPPSADLAAPVARNRGEGFDPDDLQAETATRQPSGGYGLTAAQIEKLYGSRGDETVLIIVQLEEPSVVSYRGGVAGLAASAAAEGQPFNAAAPAAQAYIGYLNNRHAQFANEVAQVTAAAKPVATYVAALNGVALSLPASQVLKVSQLPGVRAVFQDAIVKPDTDRGPQWIEAPALWSALGGQDTAGEGVVVGVIDGGAWSPNVSSGLLTYTDTLPSYADDASVVGGAYAMPFTSVTGRTYTQTLGVCRPTNPQPSDGTFECTNKLIGGYWYNAGTADLPAELDSPIDEDGHGTHTSTTAAGNVVTVTAGGTNLNISGVAPRARIIAYKACWNEDPDDPDDGGCAFVDTTAAVNQAILDGVNVLNYSIGGGGTLGGDVTELAFLEARAAGIFVATSAGNDGPTANTVGHRSPWVTTTAAMDHDRDFRGTLTLSSPFTTNMPDDLEGASATGGYTGTMRLAPLQAGESGPLPSLCNQAYAPGTFSGEIVVCRRGIDPRVEKGYNVLQGGAGGYVLVNAAPNQGLALDPHWLPALHLEYNATSFSDAGEDLVTYLTAAAAASATVTGTLSGGQPVTRTGDVMASFSSRGPTGINLIKPDLAAPGTAIFAGSSPQQYENYNPDGNTYQFQNGTSMASPHAAGAGALMVALHPTWSPAQIQSALMTGAVPIVNQDGTTPAGPFDQGSGRIDLSNSMDPGLVFDVPIADYRAVVSGTKAVETLNYPSMANIACLGTCSWTRTGLNVSGASSTYTWTVRAATPGLTVTLNAPSYSVGISNTVTFTATADVTALPAGQAASARLVLVETTTGNEVVLPVLVVPTFGTLPAAFRFEARRDAGSIPLEDVTAIAISDLTTRSYGLVEGARTTQSLPEDPTPSNPYDNIGNGSFFITTTVPAGAVRFVAEISESSSVDIDLYVGIDADGDGPEASEEVDASATGAVLEYVSITAPAPGTYWVLVQNWEDGQPSDPTTVAVAAVPNADAGNLDVTGPASVPALSPFDLRVFWDVPNMDAGDRFYGAFDVGPSSGQPGLIGLVTVDLVRLADDVVKTASTNMASPGQTVTYTITINPNVLPEDLNYTITDTIPAGLTYVPGSATNGAVVVGNTLTWSGTMIAPPEPTYLMSTSVSDPDNCAVPLANSGAYLNAVGVNPALLPNASVSGDTAAFTAFSTGAPFEFWGSTTQGLTFTDDGFVRFGSTSAPAPWIHQDLPDPTTPNNVAAILWRDMEIIYATAPISRGVTLVTLGGTGAGGGALVEYDDIQLFEDGSHTLDMEMFMWRSAGPGPEIIYAFDNISGTISAGTVGVENADGTKAVEFAHDNAALSQIVNGFAVCFDWSQPPHDPATITYAVTVDLSATTASDLTNTVASTVNNPGSKLETTGFTLLVEYLRLWLPIIAR